MQVGVQNVADNAEEQSVEGSKVSENIIIVKTLVN